MLKWVFGADVGPFKRGLAEMRGEVQAFSGSVKGMLAGAFGGAAVAAWATGMIQQFARVQDIADRFGVSAETIQRLGFSAKMSGTDAETAAKGYTKLVRSVAEAENGSESANEAFATLGINVAQFKNFTPEQQLVEIAKGLESSANRGQAFNAILQILGKSGAEMLPMLEQGAAALADQLERAPVAAGGAVKAIAELDDAIESIKAEGAPVFAWLVNAFRTVGEAVGATVFGMIEGFKLFFTADFLSLDGIKKATEDWKQIFGTMIDSFSEGFDKIWDKSEAPPLPKSSGDSLAAQAEEQKKTEKEIADLAKERLKLEEEIAKLKEDSRKDALSNEEAIIDAIKRRNALEAKATALKQAADATSDPKVKAQLENDALEAKKQSLEAAKEEAELYKKQDDERAKAAEKEKQAKEKLDQTLATEAEKRRGLDLDNMSDIDRLKALKGDKAASDRKAAGLEANGDKQGASEERQRGLDIQKEINSLTKSTNKDLVDLMKQAPTIATSSLQSIGAGGTANVFSGDNTQRRMLEALLEIANNTRSEGGTTTKPQERI